MHIKTLIRQTDGDSRSHCGFTHTAFAHQHNQTVFTAGDIIDRTENDIFSGLFCMLCSGSNAISACSLSRPFNAGTPTMFSG